MIQVSTVGVVNLEIEDEDSVEWVDQSLLQNNLKVEIQYGQGENPHIVVREILPMIPEAPEQSYDLNKGDEYIAAIAIAIIGINKKHVRK